MDQTGRKTRQRTLRHAAPERVRELLHAYRRRAEADRPRAPRRSSGIPVEPPRLGSAVGRPGSRA
jgi:hypothetical protein